MGNMYSDSVYQWNIVDMFLYNERLNYNMKYNKFIVNWDWIAGFFDGEGSVVIKVSSDKRKKYRIYFGGNIQIVQTNRFILQRIRDFIGYGRIECKKMKNEKWSTRYTLSIQKEEECLDFIEHLNGKTHRKNFQLLLLRRFFKERNKRRSYYTYSKKDALFFLTISDQIQLLNAHNKITDYNKKIRQNIEDFNEEVYLDKLNKTLKKRGERLGQYSRDNNRIDISKEKLKLFLDNGRSARSLVKEFGCSYATILRRVEEYKIPYNPTNRKIKISKEELKIYLQSLNLLEIAKIYSCSEMTIKRRIKECNLNVNS